MFSNFKQEFKDSLIPYIFGEIDLPDLNTSTIRTSVTSLDNNIAEWLPSDIIDIHRIGNDGIGYIFLNVFDQSIYIYLNQDLSRYMINWNMNNSPNLLVLQIKFIF